MMGVALLSLPPLRGKVSAEARCAKADGKGVIHAR